MNFKKIAKDWIIILSLAVAVFHLFFNNYELALFFMLLNISLKIGDK